MNSQKIVSWGFGTIVIRADVLCPRLSLVVDWAIEIPWEQKIVWLTLLWDPRRRMVKATFDLYSHQ